MLAASKHTLGSADRSQGSHSGALASPRSTCLVGVLRPADGFEGCYDYHEGRVAEDEPWRVNHEDRPQDVAQ